MRNRLSYAALLATALCGPPAAASGPTLAWTIPGTVNAGGLNNTRFVSDLAVTNPGATAVQATISFLPAGATTPKHVTLNAGQTLVYRNVLDSLWGAQGAGATQVAGDGPLLIRARTYNTAASGTYGVSLPVFADERLLGARDSTHSLWISQSADGASGYRTNVAVVFPDAGGGSATVIVYDADGHERGSQDFALTSAGFQQFAVGSFAGPVSVGRAQLRVTRGRAAGYSVVVDNVTGDSSLFAFEDAPAGHQDVLVNGVARANGRNGTFFRTDGRFYNPGAADASVSVAFHANQNSNPTPLTRTFTVPAGKVRDVVDVLDSLLGLGVGSAGALRFTSDAPVAILCRTSNVDPAGVKPGTFGAQQKPTPLLSFLMSADAGAVVTGIRESASFRTNVGFAAGADGAAYSLALKNASGATVATATRSLGPFGWTQPNVQLDLFPGTPVPDDATLLVRVTSGSVDVFDSSIDNSSGDPVVTPIMPLPADIPSSATIGSQGGSIRSSDGRLTLRVPAGALAAGTALSLVETANGSPQGRGSAYRLSPGDLAFAVPAQLTFRYALTDAEGGGPDSLGLSFSVGGTWYVVTRGAVDSARRTLIVPIPSTTPSVSPSARTETKRGGLANAFQEWGPFLARDLTPKFSATVEDARVTFSVAVTGYSSSDLTVPGVVALGLPVNPQSLIYTWYANDTFDGDAATGTIDEFQNVGRYQAPHCAPHRNPVQIRVDIVNPNGSTGGIPDRVTLRAWIKVLPRHWEIHADMDQFTTCADSSDHAQRQEWKDIKYSFDISETVTNGSDGPILTFVNPSSPGGVAGKTTKFSVCYPETCSYVLETPQTLAFSDLGGSYNIQGETLTLIVGLGGISVVLFPGWTATCPAPPGPPNVFPFPAFGSALLPYFSLFNRLVEPGFVIEYERVTPIEDTGGNSVTARIFGVPCQ